MPGGPARWRVAFGVRVRGARKLLGWGGAAKSSSWTTAGDGGTSSESSHVEAAVDVQDFAGGEGEEVFGEGDDGFGDVIGLAPAFEGGEVFVEDEVVVLGFDGAGHVGL